MYQAATWAYVVVWNPGDQYDNDCMSDVGESDRGVQTFEYGALEWKMGDWTGIREVGYRTSRNGRRSALLAACV